MKQAKPVIVGGIRIPFARSFTSYSQKTTQELMTATLQALVKKYGLEGKKLGDVSLGAIMKHAKDWNLARECVLGSGLDPQTPAFDLQRACGTSLEAVILLANKISVGQIEVGIAAGVDTNSDLPFAFSNNLRDAFVKFNREPGVAKKLSALTGLRAKDFKPNMPAVVEPRTGLSMGEHTEKMVKEWKVSREAQDELALASHQNAAKAWDEGFFNDLVVEYAGVKKDTFVRADTSLEKLAKLKTAFDKSPAGSLTAGNSSPLTDGAAAVLVASEEYAKKNNLPILAHFVDGQVAAVDFVGGEGLLMAPAWAVAEMLTRNELTLQDFEHYEIHEAFAGQVLCTLKAWESEEFCKKRLGLKQALGKIDRAKLNVKGSSVALGHPFAATGARIVSTLGKLLNERGSGRGLISVCTAGGMGVAAILEKRS